MKLTKDQIKQIDTYLIKLKIKYIDVRLELIDHLASDFENSSSYVLIEDYLKTKLEFIIDFEKKRQKTIHWSYQRQFRKRLAMFFYKPKYIVLTLLILGVVYWLQILQPNKTVILVLIGGLAIIHFTAIISLFKDYKTFKKLQIAQPLCSIMALPSLFLYTMGAAKSLLENQYFFIAFWFLAILFNVAGATELYYKKKSILEYNMTTN